ncbi:hypothetical protein Scep_001161 [Stephania cephalantha]|uniref:Uncharacterized protein n=1 Tax=Stephania cephalantha TaxID=152367 RepID=A0AAP0Q3J3_9MAGN
MRVCCKSVANLLQIIGDRTYTFLICPSNMPGSSSVEGRAQQQRSCERSEAAEKRGRAAAAEIMIASESERGAGSEQQRRRTIARERSSAVAAWRVNRKGTLGA